MISRTSIRAARARRVLAAGLAAVLAMVVGGAVAMPVSVDILSSYISAIPAGDTLPTGLLTPRGIDLPTPHQDRGHDGSRRPGAASSHASQVRDFAMAAASAGPEDHAARALIRAGRLAAPATAPPRLS